MSKSELVAALQALETPARIADLHGSDQMALVHQLEVHQIELEMQNRQLQETQQALERSERRYSDLYNFAPIIYLTLDRDGRIEEANLTAVNVLGVERSLIVGTVFVDFVAIGQRPRFGAHFQRCLAEGTSARVELQIQVRDRKPLPVEIVSVPIRDDEGRIVGLRTTLTDIGALKRNEERFMLLAATSQTLGGSIEEDGAIGRALNAVLRSLVPAMADVAFVDLVDGDQFRRFGTDTESSALAAGWPDQGFSVPVLGPNAPQHRVIRAGEPLWVTASNAVPGARGNQLEHEAAVAVNRPVSLLLVPLTSRDRKLGVLTLASVGDRRPFTGVDLIFATDVGSRIAAAVDNHGLYRKADAAIRAREDVLSFVAHDLRGLLSSVDVTVEMLLAQVPPVERRRGGRKQLERVKRSTEQMSRMIEEILDVGSLESGTLALDLANLVVDDLAIQTREQFAAAAAAKGISLEVRLSNEAIAVRGDVSRVMRILANLVGNAIKFTSRGIVTISSSIAERYVLFSVRDTGVGVAPEHLPRLFDRYWRVDPAAGQGRGLGLYIAKRFVEAHGGTLWAESKLGVGTTMFFTLPRTSPSELGLHAQTPESGRAAPDARR